MTLALNRLLPLSGNNHKLWLIIALVWCASCSPKVKQPVQSSADDGQVQVSKPAPKPVTPIKPPAPKFSTIALIMPFNLDNLARGYSKASLKQANMGVAYYRGFKLALDSLAAEGYNYRMQLLDGKDDANTARDLALSPKVRNSQLVIGPVFPESIKSFSVATGKRKLMVSPLSPTSPTNYYNPSLITVTPPLDYHAKRMASYVVNRLKAKKVFILKSGFSEDNKYIYPFKQMVDSLTKLRVKVIPFTVVRGSLAALQSQLSATESNVFLLPSVNQAFLQVTLRSLDTLSKHYSVTLIGHPSWEGFSFLRAEQLQRLKTVITSTEHVNYKSPEAITFIRSFRKAYHTEPDLYAIKGFDEGMYFGDLLSKTETGTIKPDQTDYEGISNNFHFVKKPGLGWINTHVAILRYANYELKTVE